MTRDEVVLMVRQQADAEDSSRWSPGEVLSALDVTFRREWDNILASAPYERVNIVTAAQDVTGLISTASLTTGTGDARKVFRNVIQLSDGVNVYTEVRVDMVPPDISASNATTARVFYRTGDGLQVYPVSNGLAMRVVVNCTPVAPLDLVDGDSTVDFPADGMVMLAMASAALLLAKGATETSQTAALLNLAAQQREDMLQSIRRRTNTPKFMRYPDSSASWGSR